MREKEMNEQPNQILLEIKNPFKKNVVKLREKKNAGKQRHLVETLLFTHYFSSEDSGWH